MPDSLRDAPKQSVAVVPAGAGVGVLRERYNSTLQMLLAICALVLLVGCANLAHLLLARASARRTQTAVRRAIGATRMHVATEALTESVVLAAGGAVGGLLVAMAGARLLVALAFRTAHVVPIVTTPSVRVLVVTIALAFATAIVFGAAPAWFATRTDPMDALRGPGRATSDASRARGALVIVQAMLSVVLVAGAVMLARSLDNLRHQDFGYRVQGRVVVGLNRLPLTYSLQRLSALYDDIERRLAELPGIRGAGLALDNPLMSTWVMDVAIAGRPREASSDSRTSWDRVSAGYLQHLGVGLVRGRAFTPADNETTAPVAVVNEAFVRRFFRAGEDPLDRRFGIELPEHPGTVGIVGIVRDAKFARADLMQPARAMFFLPLAQRIDYKDDSVKMIERFSHFAQGMVLVTDARPADLEPLLRRTLAEIDPNLTITTVRTMQEQIDVTFDRERAVASLAELFGMVALVLAAVGVYGVTAYMVAQQTNELRIRMALGADRTSVIGLVLRRTLRRVAVGLVVGLPLAVLAARLMAARLYGVSTSDPFALASAAGALALSACAAAIIPATRAAALSPTIVLRSE
jgi:predicted permease